MRMSLAPKPSPRDLFAGDISPLAVQEQPVNVEGVSEEAVIELEDVIYLVVFLPDFHIRKISTFDFIRRDC